MQNSLVCGEGITIKKANWDDMNHVAKIIKSSADWYKSFVHEKDMAEHDVDEGWKKKNFLKRNFFLCYKNGNPIGTVSTQEIDNYTYLGYVYLDTKHVGKGYGHKLMTFAKNWSKSLNKKGMILIAHPKANWAVKAYEKFGFRCIAETKKDVLTWKKGSLLPYYEEGFQLYEFKFH